MAGAAGTVEHAQLVLGNGMIMLGSLREASGAPQEAHPDPLSMESTYIIVDDVDAHHVRAATAGGRIVSGPEDQPYGGRLYSCLDPEGHVWHFGSYDPWA